MTLDKATLRGTFLDEARELLASMEQALLEFEQSGECAETVRTVFRAAHTLKGSAGLFELTTLVRFAHEVETVLDALRANPELLTPAIAAVLTDAHDEMDRGLDAIEADEAWVANPELVAQLRALAPAPGSTDASAPAAPSSSKAGAPCRWALSIAFNPTTFRDGFDPLALTRFLERLGTVSKLQVETAAIPTDASFDPLRCYLALSLELETTATREQIESSFEFVREGSEVKLVDLSGPPRPSAPPPPAEATGLRKDKHDATERAVKVPAARLDALVDMVSELVIAGATADVHAGRTQDRATIEAFAAIRKLVAGIRDAALGLRMVQIGDTFARFRRVVREVSRQLHKEVEVEVRGGDTELDKAMVERLSDPLLHIIRNAIDHGIERPEERERAGKPRVGTLWLEAAHQAGQIVVEVRDDGAGLNRARIKQKAIERGLIDAHAELTDAQIDELIFTPGFSSADAVSDVSGRGVGMDVVRKGVDALRGTVEVSSEAGAGTTIRMRLPLTLAIIDGFLLAVGDSHFVVPAKLVRECLDFGTLLDSEENHRLKVRGEAVPYVRLREFYELGGPVPRRESVVIVEYGDDKVALVVDRLLGVSQTVIKPLGPLFRKYEGVGGSTILGSGEVALIIDLPQLVRLASRRRVRPVHRLAVSTAVAVQGGLPS
ncbi:MAG: chemotaxis protein CheA [Myxococcaceae bacterium]